MSTKGKSNYEHKSCWYAFLCLPNFVLTLFLKGNSTKSGAVTMPLFRCDDHVPLYNLFNVILKNLGMFNVNSFCHLHSFFARCFYSFVEFFVLRKQKRNKLPTTTTRTFSISWFTYFK